MNNHSTISIWILSAGLLILLIMFGCAQYDNDTGKNLIGTDLEGVLHDTTITIERCAMKTLGDRYNYSSPYLALGKQEGMTADILLRFFNYLPVADTFIVKAMLQDTTRSFDSTTTVDSVQWHSASLQLTNLQFVDTLHQAEYLPWNSSIYRVDESYDPFEISYDDPMTTTLIGETNDFGSVIDSGDVVFAFAEIPISLDSLRDGKSDTLDIRIIPAADASSLKLFFSRSVTDPTTTPKLKISATWFFSDSTTLDSTVGVVANFNTFLSDDIDFPDSPDMKPERLYLSRGYVRRILFQADMGAIVDSANTINRVELWLNTNIADEPLEFNPTKQVELFMISKDWSSEPDSANLDIRYLEFHSLNDTIEQQRFDITSLARFWHAYPDSNLGFGIRNYLEYSTMGRRVYYGNADSVEDSLKPKLRIVFAEYNLP